MCGDGVAEHLNSQVGVDALLAWFGKDSSFGKRQARAVRQQVPNGRSLGPRRFAQVNELLLDGDKRGPRGEQLGDRGQREHRCRVPVREGDVTLRADDGVGVVERKTGQVGRRG